MPISYLDSDARTCEQALSLNTLLDALVHDGHVCPKNATQLRNTQHSGATHPLTTIAKQGWRDAKGTHLTIEMLLMWLSQRYGQPFFTIDPLTTDVLAVTDVMSYAFAKRHRILAVKVSMSEAVIANCDPIACDWEQHLAHVVNCPIKRVLVNPIDLDRFTDAFYSLASSVRGATKKGNHKHKPNDFGYVGHILELGTHKTFEANDQPIVHIVDWMLHYAFEQRASDIHIEPHRNVTPIRFRIDGILHTVYELPTQVGTAVISRLKILSHLDVAEKRRPQDGRLTTKILLNDKANNEVELRLATLPTAFGEKMVLRLFDTEVLRLPFDQLGLSKQDHVQWQTMIKKTHGLVLVTGPTGSGKTTTLYATLRQLATPEVNVCTIEDPIEMVENSFNQMQVQHSIGLDFASGIRALLRQDPDIIMVGEIRDLETATMAIQAALTGHLVLSTLHTNDAPSAIIRMLELGVPAYLLKATLLGVMTQRLLRSLCRVCKQKDGVDKKTWQQLTSPWELPPPDSMYRNVGCPACRHTGYHGRQSIAEILPLSEALQILLDKPVALSTLRAQAIKEGMRPLQLAGAQAVVAGDTTIEEMMRVMPPAAQEHEVRGYVPKSLSGEL